MNASSTLVTGMEEPNQPSLRIDDLPVGLPLPFNIVGAGGQVLFRAGYVLKQADVELILARGLVSDRGPQVREESAVSGLVLPYKEEVVRQVEQAISQAVDQLQDIVNCLASRGTVKLVGLSEVLGQILNGIVADVGAALSTTQRASRAATAAVERLSKRSIHMAILSSAMAQEMGMSEEECHTVGIGAMLHDLSLYPDMASRSQEPSDPIQEAVYFMSHPLRSVELLQTVRQVNPQARVIMAQVHEQIDGSGFPKGLQGHQLHTMSRIVNMVDAYLSMTEPHVLRDPVVPADAIAYLVYQATKGKFDRDIVQCFLAVESIYPVGSRVELDDDQTATVLRSSVSEPLNPIVRIDGPLPNIVDLREKGATIRRPLTEGYPAMKRLPRSRFDEVLWTPSEIQTGLIG